MRTKRSKVYKKAMGLYTSAFKFREPYQVIVDSEFVKIASKQKLDLTPRFEAIFGGAVKIMITQCAMSRLYTQGPSEQSATDLAKTFERRKCNHWQVKETDDECIAGIVGDDNRFRYCVATQSSKLRGTLRKVPGVPLVFEKRAIILMEPPSDISVGKRKEIEASKLHVPPTELASLRPADVASSTEASTSSLQSTSSKAISPAQTASGTNAVTDTPSATRSTAPNVQATAEQLLMRRKRKRVSGPNPLSVKRKKAVPLKSDRKEKTKHGDSEGDNRKGKPKLQQKKKLDDTIEANSKDSESGSAKENDQSLSMQLNADKQSTHALRSGGSKGQDPTRGLSRPEGDGTSKKALKRKRKKAEGPQQKTHAGRSHSSGLIEKKIEGVPEGSTE